MPPKPKLHKAGGKISMKNIPASTSTNNEILHPQLDPEVEQQFEVELCWCIQQLQMSLQSGKLNKKQIQDNTKALNTLMSNSAPMIKKRQVMRLSFGDYRAKIQAEENKHKNKALRIKVMPAKPSDKSVFIKRSHILMHSGDAFKFNFKTPEEDIIENVSDMKITNVGSDRETNENPTKEVFHFSSSRNEFRFNFSNEDTANDVS